jgi:hypothetical protein
MKTIRASILSLALLIGPVSQAAPVQAAGPQARPKRIVLPSGATWREQLAAREVVRYLFLRTGVLLPITTARQAGPECRQAIVLGRFDSPLIRDLGTRASLGSALAGLGPQEYWLKTVSLSNRPILLLTGRDDLGVLYAAYRLAERLGVRFYLHGDVLPDAQAPLAMPVLDERASPLFELRGIQPFHDFPEGPDWWNRDDYLAVIGQLPKLRMNFLGLHTYPEGGPNAEPTVWIGLPDDVADSGEVRSSYPSSYQNTLRGNWGYSPKKTGQYTMGSSQLFERDDFGAEVMWGNMPQPTSPDGSNQVFDRTASLLAAAFGHARRVGVKTCVGTETPLALPQALRDRVRSRGKDPSDPATIREVYAGLFERIQRAYPLDYYWFWTPEGWTWEGTKDEQVARTVDDLKAAVEVAARLHVPFHLATCGWVLGPQQDRALFDKVLPKDVAVSCINREVGRTPVDKGFADVNGRGKWAIPWMEDDPGLTSPQLWVGRMRRDAADARRYGCNGLMGIHWRTRVLGPAVSALAQAAWTQPLPEGTTDFYRDWAEHEFGPEVGIQAGTIFERIDGRLPRPSDWVDGPGGIRPDPRPWDLVAKDYAFVDELGALLPGVQGDGDRDRFAWWLNTFRYMKAMGKANCVWAQYNEAMHMVKAEVEAANQKKLAMEVALPLRRQLVAAVTELYQDLLATVSTTGELGTIMNWEAHNLPGLLDQPGEELAKVLGEALPADAQLPPGYRGPLRIIVPTVRTAVNAGEPIHLRVLVLAEELPKAAVVQWRALGKGGYSTVSLDRVARGVYAVDLRAAGPGQMAIEYYVEVQPREGKSVRFPATAPRLNQTVVVCPAD